MYSIPYSWHYISPNKVFVDALKAKIQFVSDFIYRNMKIDDRMVMVY